MFAVFTLTPVTLFTKVHARLGSVTSMASLHEKLQHLGLSQYLEGFVAEGFDTWETLLDITESDL
jgi:hypothetical protein